VEGGAFLRSARIIQNSAAPGMYSHNFRSATLLVLAVEIVISVTDPTQDTAESL